MPQIIVCARACVVHEDKLLMVSNDGSYWYLPGGHMEPDENLEICAQREIYEETGYTIAVQDVLYCSEFHDRKYDSHKVECIFYATVKSHPESESWKDLGHDQSVTLQRFFSLEEMQSRDDIRPAFLKEGAWLKPHDKKKVYQGVE